MYTIRLTRKAQRSYDSLFPVYYRPKVNELLIVLENNVRPARIYDLVQLAENTYRIRLGRVRIQYNIFDDDKVVLVYKIELRDDSTYKK